MSGKAIHGLSGKSNLSLFQTVTLGSQSIRHQSLVSRVLIFSYYVEYFSKLQITLIIQAPVFGAIYSAR